MADPYRYSSSVKSDRSDELVNTYVLRPIAGLLVRALYRTPVTPNQVTIGAIISGLVAAILYAGGTATMVAAAGLFMTLKDLLDSADGQLARAKQLYSRRGRFLDSIGDFAVDAAVFAALGWTLEQSNALPVPWVFAFLAFAGITLRVSYHVFYQASFLHLRGRYEKNRIIEEVTEEDLRGDPVALKLQKIFVVIYGWQDRLMLRLDGWCSAGSSGEEFRHSWYGDATALRLSGFLGFGTELLLLTVCSVLNELRLYIILNLVLMNGIFVCSVLYRRVILRRRISSSGGTSGADGTV